MRVASPVDGVVKTVHFTLDEQVQEGAVLVSFAPQGEG